MITFLLGCLCAGLALLAIGLKRTYDRVPAKELKRRARDGDPLSQLLYKPVAYGIGLTTFLWIIIGLASAAAFVLFAHALNGFAAFVFVAFFIWLGFLWLPSARLTSVSRRLAIWVTPVVAWLLQYIGGPLEKLGGKLRRTPIHVHTGLYEKEDLVALLESQRHQPDNRIASGEIDLLQHALQFGDKLVSDAMVPRRSARLVKTTDIIGPILMGELHASGHSRFPVIDAAADGADVIVGTLLMRDLINRKAGGMIAEAMRNEVFYVHEDFTLYQALQAVLKTKHQLFIVVNSFEEFVGILTVEDILEQVIGRQIVDEFDQYEDLRAVAREAAKEEHDSREAQHAQVDHPADEPAKD